MGSLRVYNPPSQHHGGSSNVHSRGAQIAQNSNTENCRRSFDSELCARIEHAKDDPNTFMQDHSPSAEKLSIFSTSCLMLNHIIGTGIFETPKSVWLGTRSVSGALLMWCLGGLIAFSGAFVYLELGLTIPRYHVRGKWRSVPRSGGEKNYVGSQSNYKMHSFLCY